MRQLSPEQIARVYNTMTRCNVCGYTKLCEPNECECCGRYDDGECYDCWWKQKVEGRNKQAQRIKGMSREERKQHWQKVQYNRAIERMNNMVMMREYEQFDAFIRGIIDDKPKVHIPMTYKCFE